MAGLLENWKSQLKRLRGNSRQQLADDPRLARHRRQPLIETLESEREPLVVQPEQPQERGVEIVDVYRVADRRPADVVGLSVDAALSDTAAGREDREREGVVIAARLSLPEGSPAELGADDHQRLLEQAAPLEVAEERGDRLVDQDEYRTVRAPFSGRVLKVYRHAGDSVATDQPSPIVRLADTGRLRVRLEVDEADVPRLAEGMQGTFTLPGVAADVGRLTAQTIVPTFGPTRLFNPDTSARVDTRVLDVLCEPGDSSVPLYPGQRVTAVFNDPRRAR